MLNRTCMLFGLLTLCVVTAGALPRLPVKDMDSATPEALVQSYQSLADTILAAKQTEWNLVHAILGTTYSHAQSALESALRGIRAGDDVEDDVELLATLVAQLGNEGDAAVAGVRKRLVESGHHHNAEGERQGLYEEGYVIVTRKAKQAFLGAAEQIGRLAQAPDGAKLQAEWAAVEQEFKALHAGG